MLVAISTLGFENCPGLSPLDQKRLEGGKAHIMEFKDDDGFQARKAIEETR